MVIVRVERIFTNYRIRILDDLPIIYRRCPLLVIVLVFRKLIEMFLSATRHPSTREKVI